MPGQTIESVCAAEIAFLRKVNELHPNADGQPFVIGNCQGGWALMMLAALAPREIGPILLAGSPLSYWAGVEGKNPMRYMGGLLGGSWIGSLLGDLGDGKFDGAHLVNNFESLDPANTYWSKLYNLYSKVDTERERFLQFERWWGGHFLMNREEMDWIVQNLFVGNKLSAGELASFDGKHRIDIRNIRSPIIVFASWGDNITPPQQALDWIPDLYRSVDDIRLNEQTIVYCLHEKVGAPGHLRVGGRRAARDVRAGERARSDRHAAAGPLRGDHPGHAARDARAAVRRGPLPDPVRPAHDRGHPGAGRRPQGRTRVRGRRARVARSTRTSTTSSSRRS